MGKLNYCSRFCYRYNKVVAPLKSLMGKQGDHIWTEECTAALNALMKVACDRLTLKLADWQLPFILTVDIDEEATAGAVILSQGEGKTRAIIMMVGRELSANEINLTSPELALKVAYWGMKRLCRWFMFS